MLLPSGIPDARTGWASAPLSRGKPGVGFRTFTVRCMSDPVPAVARGMGDRDGRRSATVSLRGRIQRGIVSAVAGALALFAVPLLVATGFAVNGSAVTALQRDATRAAAQVPDNTVEAGAPVRVPSGSGRTRIAVYTADGRLAGGAGPTRSELAARARDGRAHDGREAGELAAVVPVLSDGTVVGTVRAAVSTRQVALRMVSWWAGLLLLAGVVLLVSRARGRRVAARVAEPVEELTAAARQLGEGTFEIALPIWGLREADEAGAALQHTARRLGASIARERAFTRDVSHQLRTPLTGLLTGLESALSAAEINQDATGSHALATALERARHLQETIDDLLVVRGKAGGEAGCDAAVEVRAALERHQLSRDRTFELRLEDVQDAACPGAVIRQLLGVLLDNAVQHGSGRITVTLEQLGTSLAIEVADEGAGFAADASPGTGLRMAADLAESVFGTLLIRRRAPRPRVAVLLPALGRPAAPDQSSS